MEELVNKVNAAFEAFKADAALQVEKVTRLPAHVPQSVPRT